MATAKRRTSVANPAKAKRRKNPKRKLSAKQIKHFGTAAQKAALKRSRAAKRAASTRANAPKHRKRTTPRRAAKRTARKNTSTHRQRSKPRAKKRGASRRTRSNPEIITYTLGSALNPARKGQKMATAKRHRRSGKSRAGKKNSRRNGIRRRRNPFGGSWGGELTSALFVIAGAVGSKLGAQMALGTSNTGPMGYAANLAVDGIGAYVIGGPMKNKKAAAAFFSGSVVEVVLRLISDFTPFGSYVSGLGIGDAGVAGLGAYMPWNGVTPQRYLDPTNSAMVQIPSGWAPTTVVASSAPPAGMNSGMGSLYGPGGLYN